MTDKDRETIASAADIVRDFGFPETEKSLREIANRKPPAGTVRVRAAVAVADDGTWAMSPYCDDDKGQAADALDRLGPAKMLAVHFIEADVPLPVPQTIQVEVKP